MPISNSLQQVYDSQKAIMDNALANNNMTEFQKTVISQLTMITFAIAGVSAKIQNLRKEQHENQRQD